MESGPRKRRNSISTIEAPRAVTIATARNAGVHADPTRAITADQVRGYTQADPTQRPTVYLRDPATGAADGRVTQEHGHPENVGAHFQHGQERYFQNVSKQTLMLYDQLMPKRSGTTRNTNAVEHDIWSGSAPGPKQLVEVFEDVSGRVSGSYRSRSAFVDLTGNLVPRQH